MTDRRTPSEIIEDIIGKVAATETAGTDNLTQDEIRALADKVDLLIADFGRWATYKAASTEYVKSFNSEIDWHWRIRLAVAVSGAALVLFLVSMLVVGVHHANDFKPSQSHALTALIVGCITGSVIVTIAVVKGAFSNLADRNAGLPMPEHMKEIVDAAKSLVSGGGN